MAPLESPLGGVCKFFLCCIVLVVGLSECDVVESPGTEGDESLLRCKNDFLGSLWLPGFRSLLLLPLLESLFSSGCRTELFLTMLLTGVWECTGGI